MDSFSPFAQSFVFSILEFLSYYTSGVLVCTVCNTHSNRHQLHFMQCT